MRKTEDPAVSDRSIDTTLCASAGSGADTER